MARVRPRLIGISLKWFHHVHRALLLARPLREIDPSIRIVVGGNTASYWWREMHAFDCIDHIVLGDGERPLLALCEGDPSPPNCEPPGSSCLLRVGRARQEVRRELPLLLWLGRGNPSGLGQSTLRR